MQHPLRPLAVGIGAVVLLAIIAGALFLAMRRPSAVPDINTGFYKTIIHHEEGLGERIQDEKVKEHPLKVIPNPSN